MKHLIVKIKFKLASWLYGQNIVAPQILNSTSVIILPSDCSEKKLEFCRKKQQEIKKYVSTT